MLITAKKWEEIRDEFSEDERAALRAADRGEVICPRGRIVDLDSLDEALAEKITVLMADEREA